MSVNTAEKAFKLLEIIQSTETLKETFDKLCVELPEISKENDQPLNWKFTSCLFYVLDQIIESTDMNSLDDHQVNLFAEAVHKCEVNSLEICVKKHKNRTTYDTTNQTDAEYEKLLRCLRMFDKFFAIKFISSNSLFQDAQIDYLVGILSVLGMKRNQEDVNEANKLLIQLQSYIGTQQFFQFIMMVRGFQGLSKDFQVQAQIRLLQLIRAENGFFMLCKIILRKNKDAQVWQMYSIISGILGKAMKNKSFHAKMVKEIFRTLRNCLNTNEKEVIGAITYVLKDLYSKKDEQLDALLNNEILGPLNDLINPDVLLCGSILMEYDDIKSYVDTLNILFSSSTIVSLPSKLLHNHIVVLFNLYSILPDIPEREKLAAVILFVLNNYEKNDLQTAIRNLRLKDSKVNKIHQRIIYKNSSLQIGEESSALIDDTEAFISILKNSNNNQLVYEVFICFIKLLSNVQNAGNSILTGYDLDEDELSDVLHTKFYKQMSIIEPLQEMIQWKSLHSQLNEKPKEILEAIKDVLTNANSNDEQIIIIFFSIYKELLYKLRNENERQKMRDEIIKLKDKFSKNPSLKEQLDIIFSGNEEVPNIDPAEYTFNDAMKLLKSKEVYCKVWGCDNLIKMLKKRDKQVIANRHTVLAVALQNMRETESYAYLNIIKLLVALSYVLDTEVIDALMAEHQNKELEIDERLKFGEVMLKVTEDLGEMSIKFKQQLINCFLKGSRDTNNEFRTSSLANLGTVCKLLSYQIHNFFNEMFQQLEVIIKCDNYEPSKRAATMVLSQILSGMPNLMEFQDFLLPIYRLLKDIIANEDEDPQTKLHAQVGLEHLNEKTKDFLNPKLKVEKEIKIRLGDDGNPNKLSEIKYK